MQYRWTICAFALVPALAAAETRKIEDVKSPDKGAAMASWSAGEQWWVSGSRVTSWGYGSNVGMLVLADELGDKLAETGRISLIDRCFEYGQPDTTSALMWAVCGPDVKAFDMKKLDAQLTADNISPESRKDVAEQAQRILDRAKKIGDAVEAAAKDDPGVAALVKLGDQARAEWTAYLAKNKAQYDRYLALKDGVRSGKSNHKNFAGCWDQTFPAFTKLVKATKFPWEVSSDYMPNYMREMLTSTENFITATSFAACAYSIDQAGEALYAAAMNQEGGVVRSGPRSITLAKALDPNFKPKFAERSLNLESMRSTWHRGFIKLEGVNDIAPIMTPVQGVVATAKADGDITKLTFKGDTVDACLQWKTTNRIKSHLANGDPVYEQTCVKRGQVANQENDIEVPTKFAAGIKPGVSVLIVYKFPVTAWQGKKFVAVFGVPVK
jgi:hypothetical protein